MIGRPVLVLGPGEHFRAAGLGERVPVLRAEQRRFPTASNWSPCRAP